MIGITERAAKRTVRRGRQEKRRTEPEGEKRQCRNQESRPGRRASVGVVVPAVDDDEERDHGRRDDRLCPTGAGKAYEAERGEDKDGRDHEQPPVPGEDVVDRPQVRKSNPEEPRRLVGFELVGDVPVREVPGGAERRPVVRAEEDRAGDDAGEKRPQRPPAGEHDVSTDDGQNQSGLVGEKERRPADEPREARAPAPGEEKHSERKRRRRDVFETRPGEWRDDRSDRETHERDPAVPWRKSLAHPPDQEGAEQEPQPDREHAHAPETEIVIRPRLIEAPDEGPPRPEPREATAPALCPNRGVR